MSYSPRENTEQSVVIPAELEEFVDSQCDGPTQVHVTEVLTERGLVKRVAMSQKLKDGKVHTLGFTAKGALALLHDNELINTVTQAMFMGVISDEIEFAMEQ